MLRAGPGRRPTVTASQTQYLVLQLEACILYYKLASVLHPTAALTMGPVEFLGRPDDGRWH